MRLKLRICKCILINKDKNIHCICRFFALLIVLALFTLLTLFHFLYRDHSDLCLRFEFFFESGREDEKEYELISLYLNSNGGLRTQILRCSKVGLKCCIQKRCFLLYSGYFGLFESRLTESICCLQGII